MRNEYGAIVYTVCRQFSWSQLRLVIPIEDLLKREFDVELYLRWLAK
jgi:hypothetical protein